jgi:heptosyltransferase-1
MPVDMNDIERVLIVRLSAIGDVVHTMPCAAALKRSFPHIHLTWAVEDRCAPIVEENPYVDAVFSIPRHRWRKSRLQPQTWREFFSHIRDLRASRFELALDLQGLMKSAFVAKASGAKQRIGYHWQREGARMFVKPIPASPESKHVVQQYLDVVRSLGAVAEPIDFGLAVNPEAKATVQCKLKELGVDGRYAVINPSAGRKDKRWPPERFAQVVDFLEAEGLRTVLVGHTSDAPLEKEIVASSRATVRSLVGKTDLKELTAILSQATVHLCGDTGSGHIAVALGVPIVALYGPTNPERSGPYGQLNAVISRWGDSDDSLAGISVEDVLEKLRPFVAGVPSGT